MSNLALARPEKTSAMLITFTYGDLATPTVLRLTDWTSSITLFGVTYISMPQIEVTLPANTIGLKEDPLSLYLPLNGFTAELSIGEPVSRVQVEVREYIRGSKDSLAEVIFRGTLQNVVRNSDGRPDRVLLESRNVKSDFEVPLGIASTVECQWALFGPGCGLSIVSQTGQILTINKATITTSGLTPPRDHYWHMGYVEFEGVRVKVRDHQGTSSTMILERDPPRRWLGKTAKFVPGCRKTIEACRDEWGNEEFFLGLGIGIPDYHPLIETP